jgi:uncharacterized protein YciI
MRHALLLAVCLCRLAPAADPYYLVFLRPDPARKTLSKEEGDRIQKAHMANIGDMAARGVLVAAGPFDDTPHTISGIFVFRTSSLEEAKRIAAQDPTVVEHRNTVDVHAWEGPAGIGDDYFRLHKEHPETPEGMGIQPFVILTRGTSFAEGALLRQAEYVEGLRKAGKLAAAGAVVKDPDMLSIVVFRRIPMDEARRLMDDSPAVRSGAVRAEYHQWWCAEHVLPW